MKKYSLSKADAVLFVISHPVAEQLNLLTVHHLSSKVKI